MYDVSFYAVQVISYSNDPSVDDVRFGTACIIRATNSEGHKHFLLSNRHVIKPFDKLTIKTGLNEITIEPPAFKPYGCLCDDEIDLAVVCLDPLKEIDKILWNDLSSRAIPVKNILSKADTLDLKTVTPIISSSVPNHFHNDGYALPIVRRGIIATPPSKTEDEILADIACYQSYSGSPVFLESSLKDDIPLLIGIEKRGAKLPDGFYMHMAIIQCAYKALDIIRIL